MIRKETGYHVSCREVRITILDWNWEQLFFASLSHYR